MREADEVGALTVNLWSFEAGGAVHSVARSSARRPEGGWTPNRDLEVMTRTFSPQAGAQAGVKRTADDHLFVRTYEFPTLLTPGWMDVAELVPAAGAQEVRIARHYEGKFTDGRRPDWAR